MCEEKEGEGEEEKKCIKTRQEKDTENVNFSTPYFCFVLWLCLIIVY